VTPSASRAPGPGGTGPAPPGPAVRPVRHGGRGTPRAPGHARGDGGNLRSSPTRPARHPEAGAGGDVTGEDGRSGYPGVVPNRGGRVRGTGEPRDDRPPTASLGDPSSPEADPERVVSVHGRDDEPPRVSGRSRIGGQRARRGTARRRPGIATGRGGAPCVPKAGWPAHVGTCISVGHRHQRVPVDRPATTPDRPGRAREPHDGPGRCRMPTAPTAG